MKIKKSRFFLFLPLFTMVACSSVSSQSSDHTDTEIVNQENDDKWKFLIKDNSTEGWHNYLGDSNTGWQVENGILFTEGKNGDIVTNEVYENFELSLEWKIEEAGNSGVFYHVVESPEYKRMHETGPEFQIIDNENYPADLTEQQKTGALSDVLAPNEAAANAVGEWNHTRIIVNQGAVEHWLNDKKILEYQLGSDELKQQIAASKFAELPYAKVQSGRIGLQDHGGPVYYKNIKIRIL